MNVFHGPAYDSCRTFAALTGTGIPATLTKMRKRPSILSVFGGLLLAVVVATPLSSWAAASRPVAAGPAISSSRRHKPAGDAIRRVRRHRRVAAVHADRTSRAFSAGPAVPAVGILSAVSVRSSALPEASLPPPDHPPA
jgi:hypothetical protein